VIGGATLELSGESVQLEGGSALYPWDSEIVKITSTANFTAREYPISAMEQLLAGAKSVYPALPEGQITDKINLLGESGNDLDITLIPGASSDLKGGEYSFKFTDIDTGILYAMSDIGGGKFIDSENLNITGEITLSGTEFEVEGYGIALAIKGAAEFVAGDSCKFRIIEPNKTGEKLKVGALSSTFKEFSAIVFGQKRGTNQMVYIELFRVKAYGMPIAFTEKDFSEWQIDMEILYDDKRDGVFEFIRQF
jgi:hypothetical protein